MRILSVILVALLPTVASAGGEPWANEPAFKTLIKEEIKTLEGLLDTALKKDYRRQAWYFADRMVAVDPTNNKAQEVLDKWDGQELQGGKDPNKGFVKKRDGTLRHLGNQYFHFGETLEASGMDPLKYYPINVRAHAYGSVAGNLITAIKNAGYVTLGSYEPKPKDEVEACLGGPMSDYFFPMEFDDQYLKARALWPEARGAGWGTWRLMSDHTYKETLRLLGSLAAAETWMKKAMGGKPKKGDGRKTNLFVFTEWQKYDKIGGELVAEADRERFKDTSGWYDAGHNRVMVCWRHRVNGWLGDDDLMLGHACQVMARRHFAGGTPAAVVGTGAWLLAGLRGAFEGFGLDEEGKGGIDPAHCWRVAVARSMREDGKLIPWAEFFQLDAEGAAKHERIDLRIRFGGKPREGKSLDIVTAQATAVVVGILKADKGKGARKLGKALGILIKKGSIADIDKALGWKAGRAQAMAEVAMDAAHGK